jgi:hypothetical protein
MSPLYAFTRLSNPPKIIRLASNGSDLVSTIPGPAPFDEPLLPA